MRRVDITAVKRGSQLLFLATFAALTVLGIFESEHRTALPVSVTNPAILKSTETSSAPDPLAVYSSESLAVSLPEVSAKGAALLCARTGELIFGKGSDIPLPMASTTKIMTALVVLESHLELDDIVTVPRAAVGVEGSSIYLFEGERITVSDLLYGLLLESGNDAATALAIAVSGSEEEFVKEMNRKADELGLKNTVFKNPHGLTAEGHYTTAYELGVIACRAMQNEVFRSIVGTKTHSTVPVLPELPSRYFSNHNRMLRLFDGATGIKTGYTIASGRCLVSSADKGSGEFIAVTLDDPHDWKDHASMLSFALNTYECRRLYSKGEITMLIDGKRVENDQDGWMVYRKEAAAR